MFKHSIEEQSEFIKALTNRAEDIYGKNNRTAIKKWVEYWSATDKRNETLVNHFRTTVKFSFKGMKVLDAGCGTAGLARIVTSESGTYIGFDFYKEIFQLGLAHLKDLPQHANASLLRATANRLPFRATSFDLIIAFDVIEHLTGGWNMQLQFMREVKRVLKRGGIVLLTTPNSVYPYEYHSDAWLPQYLPAWLADYYLKIVKPNFLREHGSFSTLSLLSPWKLQQLIKKAGLCLLHEYPWGKDFQEHSQRERTIISFLNLFGCGSVYTKTFLTVLCHNDDFRKLCQIKKRSMCVGSSI
jgi:ubiquinone/menaquinone biosynthesis C-methylase UbiE